MKHSLLRALVFFPYNGQILVFSLFLRHALELLQRCDGGPHQANEVVVLVAQALTELGEELGSLLLETVFGIVHARYFVAHARGHAARPYDPWVNGYASTYRARFIPALLTRQVPLQPLYLHIAFSDVVGAAGAYLLDGGFQACHLLAQTTGGRLGGAKRGAGRALLRLRERNLSREVLIACL